MQCADQLGLPGLLATIASHLQAGLETDRLPPARVAALLSTLASIHHCLARFSNLNLSPHEFAFLRLCSVFRHCKFLFTTIYQGEIICCK